MWGTLGTTIFLMFSGYFLVDCKVERMNLFNAFLAFLKRFSETMVMLCDLHKRYLYGFTHMEFF